MKTLAESPWKQRVLFFVSGTIFAFICGIILFKWKYTVPCNQRFEWLNGLKSLVSWLPWIACVAVLILRFVKGKHIRIGFYFLGTIVPMVVLFGWMLFGCFIVNKIHSKKFNAELWRNHETVEHNYSWPLRLTMVDDLIASGKLKGLNKKQVIDMLGSPKDHGYFKECYDLAYWLGPERGSIRIDSEWLAISFDKEDKVKEYLLVRD